MAKIPETGKVTIAQIAAEFQGPKDLAELSKKAPLNMSGTEQVGIDDFRGKILNGMQVSGGNQIYDQDGYRYHKFTSNGTLNVVASTTGVADEYLNIDCLIVAGGGSAGNGSGYKVFDYSGGGGAGGFITATVKGSTKSHSVVVGSGGSGLNDGHSGENSSASGFGSANGGGYGRGNGQTAGGSGSGGGNYYNAARPGGASTGGGHKGSDGIYNGTDNGTGGGGGAGGTGGNAANNNGAGGTGGPGKAWLDGVTYAGGGGGGRPGMAGAAGGSGGGGNGGNRDAKGSGGTNGLGGGAGMNGIKDSTEGNNGGSGVVIFRYKLMPNVTRSISAASIDAPVIEGPPYAELPDYDPSTHKPVAEQWVDPHQKEIGWTVVELTAEEKAAYAQATKAQGDEE